MKIILLNISIKIYVPYLSLCRHVFRITFVCVKSVKSEITWFLSLIIAVFFFSSFIPMSYTVVLKLVVKNRHLVEKGSLQRYILCRKVFQVDRVVLLLSHIRSKAAQRVEQLFHIKCYILTAGFFFFWQSSHELERKSYLSQRKHQTHIKDKEKWESCEISGEIFSRWQLTPTLRSAMKSNYGAFM